MKNYIRENGTLKRYEVIDDIINGELTRSDIDDLCQDSEFKEFLVDRHINIKYSADKWDINYLINIADDAIDKGFNMAYLMHICDVSRYVRTNYECQKKQIWKKNIDFLKILSIGALILSILYRKEK